MNERHPMDEKYRCGFDPLGKTLKQCVEHWKACKDIDCRKVLQMHYDIKVELCGVR